MANVIITKEKEFDWDISVFEHGKKVKTAWACNEQQAYGKGDILADYYRDDNGQHAAVCVNK